MKKILALSCLLFPLQEVNAQVSGSPLPVSQATNASTTFGGVSAQGGKLYNTDLFTGKATITVPIYDYSINNLSLGVSLNYTTSGITVDQVASAVGLGWNLNSAPFIDRTPHGIEDEIYLKVYNNTTSQNEKVTGSWTCDAALDNAIGHVQENYDLFTANMGGRELRFTIDLEGNHFNNMNNPAGNNTKVSTYPKSEVKIQLRYLNTLVKQRINWWNPLGPDYHDVRNINFVLVDEYGNTFYFNKVDLAYKKYEFPSGLKETYLVPTRWWATKVVTVSGQEILYDYHTTNVVYPIYHDEQFTETFQYTGYDNSQNPFTILSQSPKVEKNEDVLWDGIANTIAQIKYPNGVTIKFEQTTNLSRMDIPSMKMINNIKVLTDYTNDNYIDYRLLQNYFTSSSSTNLSINTTTTASPLTLRLCLFGIEKCLNGINPQKYYSFAYENSVILPPRLSPQQDYYGYYNGKSPITLSSGQYQTTTSLGIPSFSIPRHDYSWQNGTTTINLSYGIDKTPDINYIKANVLKKVTNGLNGSYELHYEAHSLNTTPNLTYYPTHENPSNINAYDGLRLQKIVYKDGISDDHNTSVEYTYSGGEMFYKKLYFWHASLVSHNVTTIPLSGPLTTIIQRKWLNSYVSPTDFVNGSNHGYTNVTETTRGYNNQILSKTTYKFSGLTIVPGELPIPNNVWSYSTRLYDVKNHMFDITNYPVIFESQIGVLLESKNYIGNNTDPISETKYEYDSYYYTDSIANLLVNCSKVPRERKMNVNVACLQYSVNGPTTTQINGYLTDIFNNAPLLLKKKTLKQYTGSSYQETVYEYTYDNRDNLSSTIFKDSKGDEYKTLLQYVYTDPDNNYQIDNNQSLQFQFEKNLLRKTGTTYSFVSSTKTTFTNYSKPRSISSHKATVVSTSKSLTEDVEFTQEDGKQNVVEIEHENGLSYSSQLWDYKLGLKIAEFSNARFADIAYSSFEGLTNTNADVYEKGNWQFPIAGVQKAVNTAKGNAMTGKYIYQLSTDNALTKTLSPSTEYYLSFWSDILPVVKLNGNTIAMDNNLSVNGWTLYTAYFTTDVYTTQDLLINKNGVASNLGFIDEVRIRPANATAVTYTYEPLLGVSSTCDNRNNIIYTEYDIHGNAWRTKNIQGFILSQVDRTIQGGH